MDWLNLSISDALKNATAQIPPFGLTFRKNVRDYKKGKKNRKT